MSEAFPASAGPGRRGGAGRILALLYAIFALAAGARALVQLAEDGGRAPVAYGLSALAASLYLVLALTIDSPGRRRLAAAALVVELAGVIAVGALSASGAVDFGDETVWSDFGGGYGWLPLLLPVAGLAWLHRAGRADSP